MNTLLRWSPVNGRARAGRHIRSLTVGIVLSFLLIVPSQLALAQTAVEGGYKDEDGNMHWGESRPEPHARSSSGTASSSSTSESSAEYYRRWKLEEAARRRHDYEAALRYAEDEYRRHPTGQFEAVVYARKQDLAESKGDFKSAIYYHEQSMRVDPAARSLLQSMGDPVGKRLRAEYAGQQQSQSQTHSTTPTRTSTSVSQTARSKKDQPHGVAGVTPKEEAELRMQLALTLAKKGDQKGSVKELNEALKLDPNSPRQKEVYAAWKESSSGGTSNHAPANQSTSARAPADQLDADKRAPELHDFPVKKFEKAPQLPLPPILKGEPPNKVVKNELEKYMKTWKARNQEYQKATPEKAAQLKTDMEDDNKKFKEKMKKSYGVDL